MTEQAKLEHREGSSYKGLCSGFVVVVVVSLITKSWR